MYKYRIIKQPSSFQYIIQKRLCGLVGILHGWETFEYWPSMVETQRRCLDLIQEDKHKEEPYEILEYFSPKK